MDLKLAQVELDRIDPTYATEQYYVSDTADVMHTSRWVASIRKTEDHTRRMFGQDRMVLGGYVAEIFNVKGMIKSEGICNFLAPTTCETLDDAFKLIQKIVLKLNKLGEI